MNLRDLQLPVKAAGHHIGLLMTVRTFLRKCRGALGIALTWGAVWAAVFAAVALIIGVLDPDSIDPGEDPVRVGLIGGFYGLVTGAAFSLLLSLAEGRKVIRNLSLGRAALWGAIAAAAFPLLTAVNNSMVFILCPIGAALAAGSVAIAKKAELHASAAQARTFRVRQSR